MRQSFPTMVAAAALVAIGCSERDVDTLQPLPPYTDPVVFVDAIGSSVNWESFGDSRLDALSLSGAEAHDGEVALKISVPGPDDLALGGYAGGALVSSRARNLSDYTALTFWAKSTPVPTTLNVAGIGNDNTGTSRFTAQIENIPLTTEWKRIVVPIPRADRLMAERGMLFLAEGHEGAPHKLWIDEVEFKDIPGIRFVSATLPQRTLGTFVGSTLDLSGTRSVLSLSGSDIEVGHMPGYFTYISSDELVAAVDDGEVRVVGSGTAVITATLGSDPVDGEVTVNAVAPPTIAAPAPTTPAGDVVSIFSNSYSNIAVNKWSADWDFADVSDFAVGSNDIKAYTALNFAGIEFPSSQIDATPYTHFHIDVWIPEGTRFSVKLVDFGEDGAFGGAPDSEDELVFNATSSPPMTVGEWVSLDIPLADFTDLDTMAHIAQLVIASDSSTAFIDNVYFRR